jgi:hypothetical protein
VDEVAGSGLHDAEIRRIAQMVEITETDQFNAAFPARRFASATIRWLMAVSSHQVPPKQRETRNTGCPMQTSGASSTP